MVAAVVLAAGAASRFGSPKQLLLLPYVLERLERSPLAEIVVVSGAYPIEESAALSLGSARVVACPDWALGPGASLRCGLAALGDEVDSALVVLADGPYLDPRAIERVLAHREESEIVAASYDGVRGHPALLARSAWASVPDDGGRLLEVLLVPCDDLTAPGDIDTPDLAAGL
jgi:CTP:molybdopterin cytidylyltransferase MocA